MIEITDQDLAPKGDTAVVVMLAKKLIDLEESIQISEEKLHLLKEQQTEIEMELLPGAMRELGMKEFTMNNGSRITIKPYLQASLPSKTAILRANDDERPLLEARREAGFAWLRANKAGDLIKNEVTISLGRGYDRVTKMLLANINRFCKEKRIDAQVDQEETVHPGTLKAFIKEQLKVGRDLPMDTFAVVESSKAEIVQPKKDKGE